MESFSASQHELKSELDKLLNELKAEMERMREDMKEPRKYDFAYYGPRGVVCLLFSCLLAIGCYLLIGAVTVVILIGPVVLGIVAAKKYTT